MLWLKEHTARIQALADEGTPESLTFAALRCRLAIEMVCYERLRNAHDYISPDDLKRWQPRDIMNRLIRDVDPHIASSYTISMSKQPVDAGSTLSAAEFEAKEYVEIGRQAGFDAKKLGKIWNSLGSFLHVPVPQSSSDEVRAFGKVENIDKKVREALAALREIERGTLISSGIGETVTFECACGSKNKRRAALLEEGQTVSCINPDCREEWIVHIHDGEFEFERRQHEIACDKCGHVTHFPEQQLLDLERNQIVRFTCEACGADNFLMWKLMQMKRNEA